MSYGEAFGCAADVARVRDIASGNPDVVFWIPTRAWRNPEMRAAVDVLRATVPNLRVLASEDPTTTSQEHKALVAEGWSTMYFGDDSATQGRFKCPKTWSHKDGACATCRKGCFSATRVDVHLKEH